MIYQGQARDGLSSSGALKAVGAGWLLCALADVSLIIISSSHFQWNTTDHERKPEPAQYSSFGFST